MRWKKIKQVGLIKALEDRCLKSRPLVNISLCIGCGDCKSICQTNAIELFPCIPNYELLPKTGEPRQRPEIEYIKCTRCYHCKDRCSKQAILIYKPMIVKLLGLQF